MKQGDAHSRRLIGIMCGTSTDGVSAALIDTCGHGREREVEVVTHFVHPYPEPLRERLFAIFPPNLVSAKDLAFLHRDLGELLAEVVAEAAERGDTDLSQVTAAVIQAPTLYHHPPTGSEQGVHMEIGEPAIISQRTGLPVVCDLRPSDVAAGGHGAPLSVFADYVLFAHPELGRAVQNIGGIANVTFVPAGAETTDLLSFDTGPGNMVIDALVKTFSDGQESFDRDGRRAAAGRVSESLLAGLMAHPYLAQHPPKTTGREVFGESFVSWLLQMAGELRLEQNDMIATATAYTAACIHFHYERDILPKGRIDEVILYGGGAHNATLVEMIRRRVAPIPVRLHDEFGIPGDAREAVTWAILGDETLAGRPANVPNASGASQPVVLGKIVSVEPGRGRWQES